jgi:integrase
MARTAEKLSALVVKRLGTQPGMHAVGDNLYLQVKNGGASWVLRYMFDQKARYMGLGSFRNWTLADARARAREQRKLLDDGRDPLDVRDEIKKRERVDAARGTTFQECAAAYVNAHRAGWRNKRHAAQWETTLATYAQPVIGALPAQAIDTTLVLKVLEPIWTAKPETASRLRGRLEAILDWAKVRGHREGENPARWRGHLDKLLPPRSKVRRVEHHAAMPYAALPAFLGSLRRQDGVAARALEFTILTAARTGEVIGATWAEISFAEKVWTVPAARMKASREHRVPLGARALAILKQMHTSNDGFVFSGDRPGKPLSPTALILVLRRMGFGDITTHGMRSAFRDWAAEQTNFPREVAEAALAHIVADRTEAAYRRGDLFEKRRRLMAAWAAYCQAEATGGGTIVPIKRSEAV